MLTNPASGSPDPSVVLKIDGKPAALAAVGGLNRDTGPRLVPVRSIPAPVSVSESFQQTIAMPYRDSE